MPRKAEEAVVIWTGNNRRALADYGFLRLFKSTRENTRPEVEITSIDFISTMTEASPFLVALTVK